MCIRPATGYAFKLRMRPMTGRLRINTRGVLLAAFALVLIACSLDAQAVPRQFRSDRQALSKVFEHGAELSRLLSIEGQTSTRHNRAVEKHLTGLIRQAEKVDDVFLDWLHPEMKFNFKNHYVRGHILFRAAWRDENVAGQMVGIELIQRWHNSFWTRNGEAVFDRAFGR
jgi:hypothetical protein